MSTITQPPKLKRRWYQFSLKTLLIVISVMCVGFAWIGWRMQRARTNRNEPVEEAVASIQESGGNVQRDYEELRPQTWLEELFDDPGDPDDPVRVWETEVTFHGFNVTNAGLERLKDLKNLRSLVLSGSNVTNAGLERLKDLKNLEMLFLYDTQVTDAGLEHLKGLTTLDTVYLSGTRVTDAGLEHLEGMTNLEILDLFGTQFTDECLEYLKELTNLQQMNLINTNITAEGVSELQQALPNCKIRH